MHSARTALMLCNVVVLTDVPPSSFCFVPRDFIFLRMKSISLYLPRSSSWVSTPVHVIEIYDGKVGAAVSVVAHAAASLSSYKETR